MVFFPLIEETPSKRNRKYQKFNIFKEITSVTSSVLKKTLIKNLLPNIVSLFPKDTHTINTQVDGEG